MSVLFGVTGLLGSVGSLAPGAAAHGVTGASQVLVASGAAAESTSVEGTAQYVSIFWVSLVALVSPVISRLIGKRIPDVVFLLIFGMLIGPNVLGLASGSDGGIPLLKELGLGMLFLIAGFEIDVKSLRGRQGRSAITTWCVCFGLGVLGAALITGFTKGFNTYIAVGIALSSTALGTLLPMLKSHGAAGYSGWVMRCWCTGAVGELFPIFAMSLLLSSHSPGLAILILLGFMAVAVVTAIVPHRLFEKVPGLRQIMAAEANTTSQTILRLAMFLLATLIMFAALFGLDAVLGAFAAGIILRSLTPVGALHLMTRRLETVGFSFLIPLFFVVSGMTIDPSVVARFPLVLLLVVVGILLARGLPVFVAERFTDTGSELRSTSEKIELALYSAAGLPIIVAVTTIATGSGLLEDATASLLVAGGAFTVLLFPLWAAAIKRAFRRQGASADQQPSQKEQIAALKARKTAQVRLTTGMLPVVPPAQEAKSTAPKDGSPGAAQQPPAG